MSDASNVFNSGPGPQRKTPVSAAYEPFHAFAGGVLQNLVVTNKNASTRYLMLFNATSVPANTAIPVYPAVAIPTEGTGTISEEVAQGMDFGIGLVAALSSTLASLTLTTTNDGFFKATIT